MDKMEQHTKTPWKVSASGGLIVPDNDNPVSTICSGFGRDEDDFPNWPANALRIVACVNACEGISTELLEQGAGFWEKSDSHDQERDTAFADLLRVNARLLDILKSAVEEVDDCIKKIDFKPFTPGNKYYGTKPSEWPEVPEWVNHARAAIEEAEKTTHQ